MGSTSSAYVRYAALGGLLLVQLAAQTAFAEGPTPRSELQTDAPLIQLTPFFEAGGRGIMGSFNVEARVERFVLQVGYAGVSEGDDHTFAVPITAGLTLLRDRTLSSDHMLEIVAGVAPGNFPQQPYYTGAVGWRWRWNAWQFRAGISPLYQPKNRGSEALVFFPWPYASFGYGLL